MNDFTLQVSYFFRFSTVYTFRLSGPIPSELNSKRYTYQPTNHHVHHYVKLECTLSLTATGDGGAGYSVAGVSSEGAALPLLIHTSLHQ